MTTSSISRPGRRREAPHTARTVTTSVALAATVTAVAARVAVGSRRNAARSAAAAAPAAEAPAPAAIPAEPAAVVQRPTPRPRTPEPVARPEPTDAIDGSARLLPRRPPPVRRWPSLCLAAAVVTAVGVSGGLSSAGPAAQAGTTTRAAPVSVAEKLGITAEAAAPVVDAETTDRLGELVASRAERDAEQVRAARVQAKADRAAAEAERRAAAAAAEAARPDVVLPVKGARLTSGFGARWGTLHAGIDLAAPMHTPEYAVMDGIVLEAGPASGYGLAVYIQHENRDVTVYGHMDEILVSAGQVVRAGDTIALLGNTGQSTGPHLHFEVHQGGLDGTRVDPLPWLRERGLRI